MTFPPVNVLIALVGTVVLALLIMRLPLRRAVRSSPARPSAMPEPAIELPRVLRGARLTVTQHVASVRLDVLLFTGSAAIVAVHAAVDSFFAPEPGTSLDDHLVRGSVSLAMLGLAIVVFPRVRSAARAAIAAALGVLVLEGAGLAIADARAVGARGEDWTGFLLLPVGLVLLGLAAVLLWRSRKPGRLRYLRRGAILIATIVGTYVLVVPLAMGILATHRPRATVESADLGRPYQQVTIRTSDGLDARRLVRPVTERRGGDRVPTRHAQPVPHARMLVRHGYGVLLLDAAATTGVKATTTSSAGPARRTSTLPFLAGAAARHRSGPDRRHRILGRRRDHAPGRGLQPGAACGRL